jgi:hypothetical protein
MTELIDACGAIDKLLVQPIETRLEPVLLLEDIEAGSIRTWLRDQLMDLGDDSLGKLEWKPLVGKYLVKAKYRIVNFLEHRSTITDRANIVTLQRELLAEAEQAQIRPIPLQIPVPESEIVNMIKLLSDPLSRLRPGDYAKYITASEEASFNLDFTFAPEAIETLITKEVITGSMEMNLKVKRPDYLGDAMWDLRHEGHPIEAKIMDLEWLRAFQQRQIEVRPGDAIRAIVQVDVRYDYDNEVVGKRYIIIKVLRVVPGTQVDFMTL